MAISGDTVVVGAFTDDVGGNIDQGSAYVFVRSGGSWSRQVYTTAAAGEGGGGVGGCPAMSEETGVVGVGRDAVGGNRSQGSADVY